MDEVGKLGHRGAGRDLDGVELGEVLVVLDGLLDALLLLGLGLLLLAALLAATAAARGFLIGLGDGLAGLLENVLAVVLLGGTGHATVAVAALILVAATLAAAAAAATTGILTSGLGGGVCIATGPAHVALGATVATRLLLLLGGFGSLLGKDLLLLGDLVEQAREGRHALGGGVLGAARLLLGGAAGLLGLALLLGLAAGLLGLCLRLGGGFALLLATLLGGQALGLGLLGGLALGGCLGLLLGLLCGFDLGRAGLQDRLELLADHGDIGVLESRGRGLRRDHHFLEVAQHLLAGHPVFLREFANAGLCHVTYLPATCT